MQISPLKRRLSSRNLESSKAMRSTLILQPNGGSPLLMLSQEKEDSYGVYNPCDDRVYEKKRDLSGYRFLVDSGLKLYIIDVFSEEMIIDLPPLESFKGSVFRIERVGENVRHIFLSDSSPGLVHTAEELRGVLWVDDENNGDVDYVVVWVFERSGYIGFCKKGDDHYREIKTRGDDVRRELRGDYDMVLKGHNLYVFATREFVRHLDLSGGYDGGGFKDVSESHDFPMWRPSLSMDELERISQNKVISSSESIAVTRSGQVSLVYTYELITSDSAIQRMFHLYKRNPNHLAPKTFDHQLVEVHSLGDEALFLDLGTTVPADRNLGNGIEPNSIYFTRGHRVRHKKTACLYICVFNLATKTIKSFPGLSNLNIKDAQWFLPS